MRYLLDELHAYEHDYSGALRQVSHKANSSLAGERALYAPALRMELTSFQTLIIADMKDVHGSLANLDTNVGCIEDVLRGLTDTITGACPGLIPTPSSGGHPSAYLTLSGTSLWFFICAAADC